MNVPILPGSNLAPLKPLLSMADTEKPVPTYISDGIRELLSDCLRRNKDTWKEIAHTTEVTSNFIQGKQIWQPNYWNNTWTVRPIALADPNKISAINIMQFYCTSQLKMITQSNPDIEPIDEFKQREYKEAVKIAKAVWNRYEEKFYTAWFNQQEALHAIVSGTYIESVSYDHLAKGAKVYKEIFGTQSIEISPGYGKCFSCTYEGTYSEFAPENDIPHCPECGSYEILPPEPPVTQDFESIIGVEPMQLGDLSIKLKPIQAVRFDITKRPNDSSWMIYREEMPRKKLAHIMGDINLPGAGIELDEGLRSLKAIANAGNTLAGKKQTLLPTRTEDTVIVDHFSVSAEDIAHIIPRDEEKTVSGEIIKRERLSDQFPNGGTFLILNEKDIIGFYPDVHHSKEISAGVYHMRLESGLGRGSEDTVEVQKRFTRFDAQNVKFMESAATPAKTYIKGAVDRNHIKQIGNPGAVIPINQEIAMALGNRPVIEQLQPGSMAAQFFSYTYDILNQYRQLTSHATDASGAFPGVDNRTATGAKLAKSNAESIFSPMLQIKSEVRVKTAHNTLCLYNEHFKGVSQYVSFGETDTGQSIGGHVKGEDINTDVQFTVVRDSEQPKTMYDRQTDFANMMMVASSAGGIQMVQQTDPKLYEAMLRVFDIDIDNNTYSVMADVCEDRLEEAFALQEQYLMVQQAVTSQGMEMPEIPIEGILMGLSQPIAVEEPNHLQKAKWFMDFLDTPQGFALEDTKREVVRLFVRTHFQFETMQQAAIASGFAQVQMAAQQPMMDAQAENQNQQVAQQQEAENLQYQRQQEKDQAAHDRDMEGKLMDAGINAANADLSNQQATEGKLMDSALRVGEAKAMPNTSSKSQKKK